MHKQWHKIDIVKQQHANKNIPKATLSSRNRRFFFIPSTTIRHFGIIPRIDDVMVPSSAVQRDAKKNVEMIDFCDCV